MATYYIDYVNGNDSNSGTSWNDAWKTITNGATAARIAPGDTIRIAKSPDPQNTGVNATWTEGSVTVTLASPLTVNIEMCESAWTASTNVTTGVSSSFKKEGSYSCYINPATAFTTGKLAYKTLPSALDLSAYQQISLWFCPSIAISAGWLQIKLCSDTAGNTAVNTFDIPALPSGGSTRFTALTLDYGSPLGSNIQSIALYATYDFGAAYFYLDDIIACKAPGNDALSLTSLISPSASGEGGWWGIRCINGSTVTLDSSINSNTLTAKYGEGTNTTSLYKREPIFTTEATGSSSVVQEVQDSGEAGNLITFSGGWNTSTNEQDGYTFYSGRSRYGWGYGLKLSSKSYIKLERLGFFNYDYGIYFTSSSGNNIVDSVYCNTCNYSIYSSSGKKNIYSNLTVNGNVYGLYLSDDSPLSSLEGINNFYGHYNYHLSCSSSNKLNVKKANYGYSGSSGIVLDGYNNILTFEESKGNQAGLSVASNNKIYGGTVSNNSYGIVFSSSTSNVILKNITLTNNSTAGIFGNAALSCYLSNCTFNETTEVNISLNYRNNRLCSHNHNGISGYHKIFTDNGLIERVTDEKHGNSSGSWKFSPTTNLRDSDYPLDLKLARFAVSAEKQVTISCWVKKSHATDIGAKLVLRGGQIAGVENDVVSTAADSTDWQQLQIQFTPTENGVVEVEGWAYWQANEADENVKFSDFSINQ